MTWLLPLEAGLGEPPGVIGSKAHGLVTLLELGLPVPEASVIPAEACRAYLREGRLPPGLAEELAGAVHGPVSVRSGAEVSMPGMMNTLLDVREGLVDAVEAIFASWDTPRARTYRTLHDIPHDLGTAVIVQTMVYGERGCSGVAFSRNPNTGEPGLYGEVLFGQRGDEVVSGRAATRPLADLSSEPHIGLDPVGDPQIGLDPVGEPLVSAGLACGPRIWAELQEAMTRIEARYRDACHVEFTVDEGRLWFLQVRPGGLSGRAAVRVAVDLVDEGVIDREEALSRISPRTLAQARTPRITGATVVARGLGACPGVATGRVATTADSAVRMAGEGPVILVRPETSPLDMHGLAAAAGVVTARGGPTCHAAVVARSMGKPAVVGVGEHSLTEGTLITIDGSGGEVVLGRVSAATSEEDPQLERLLGWAVQKA